METKEISNQARIAQRKYQQEWRAKNKEKVREYNRKYWERRAEEQDEREK